jgi:hypothetical protein
MSSDEKSLIENPTTLNEVRNEIRETKAAFKEFFEGDLCEGRQQSVREYAQKKTEPYVAGFEAQMRAYGVNTPEEARQLGESNPLIREQAQFASANMYAIMSDAAARRWRV